MGQPVLVLPRAALGPATMAPTLGDRLQRSKAPTQKASRNRGRTQSEPRQGRLHHQGRKERGHPGTVEGTRVRAKAKLSTTRMSALESATDQIKLPTGTGPMTRKSTQSSCSASPLWTRTLALFLLYRPSWYARATIASSTTSPGSYVSRMNPYRIALCVPAPKRESNLESLLKKTTSAWRGTR